MLLLLRHWGMILVIEPFLDQIYNLLALLLGEDALWET
jgi:hypothetical protein